MAELIRQATEETAMLARSELRLAQLDVGETAGDARIGIALLVAAGVITVLATGVLIAMLVLLLAMAVGDTRLAALVLGIVLYAVAGIMWSTGMRRVDEARDARRSRAIRRP